MTIVTNVLLAVIIIHRSNKTVHIILYSYKYNKRIVYNWSANKPQFMSKNFLLTVIIFFCILVNWECLFFNKKYALIDIDCTNWEKKMVVSIIYCKVLFSFLTMFNPLSISLVSLLSFCKIFMYTCTENKAASFFYKQIHSAEDSFFN